MTITATVTPGQVWKDKDKRRNRSVEVLSVTDNEVHARIIGTEDETSLKLDRFVKRWEFLFAEGNAVLGLGLEAILAPKFDTREAWLNAAVELLTEHVFAGVEGVTIPDVRVSVGWPGGRGPKGSVVGQCWKTESAKDKVSQIFISPVVDNSAYALATLAHELIHASDDGESGHRGHFKRTAQAIGFLPKFTVVNPSDELSAKLEPLTDELGPYPHAGLIPTAKPKVQKTYMLKLGPAIECDECDPDYKIRMTFKWLEEAGAPLCPHGFEMEETD